LRGYGLLLFGGGLVAKKSLVSLANSKNSLQQIHILSYSPGADPGVASAPSKSATVLRRSGTIFQQGDQGQKSSFIM